MLRRWLCLITLGGAVTAVSAAVPTLSFETRPWGRLAIAPFESAPYPHPSRDEGFASGSTFYPRDQHYIDSSVAILVPNGYEANGPVDIVFHLHGHGNHLTHLIPQYRFGEQLEESGVNAIMIVPQGPYDASDSRFGKLDEPGGFARLIQDCLQALRESRVTRTETLGRVIVMGHSGGYYTIGQIIANGDLERNIEEVWLWDSAYAQQVHYADFVMRPHTRLRSIFTGHLAEENTDIMTDLQRRGAPILFLADTLVTDEQLATERAVFLRTDVAHNEVMTANDNLARWLRTSTLAHRR